MNISYPFIRRPVGTILLALGLFLSGAVAYAFLPVASLPAIELPTIRVSANRPGADPSTMAATVAAPLERRLGEIAGVTELTSTSSLGSTVISIQFDISRSLDGAARDVQAALNAALSDLPLDLPTLPTVRKANSAAAPIIILALTSDTLSPSAVYDAADTVIAQRIAQTQGVGEVIVSGAEQPAVRVRADGMRLASMGLSMDQVRAAISGTNALTPVGSIDGPRLSYTLATNGQLGGPRDYDAIVVKNTNGDVVRLSSVAKVDEGTRNSRSAAYYNGKPAILLIVSKQADANVIDTVDRIKAFLPTLQQWIPAGIEVSILTDRTTTIRASVADMQWTLFATAVLVMLVVYLFLRRGPPTIAAGVTVPLSLAGTCAAMWLAGFTIDNFSLMALAVAVGFVVDDAIVMIENVYRNLEMGKSPLRAAIEGSKQIGFTVVSISVSLVAAFTPLLLMGGIVGRLFREFSVTLVFAIVVSTIVSLTVTPMVCAHFIRHAPEKGETWLDRLVEGWLRGLVGLYRRSLDVALRHPTITVGVFLLTIALTAVLFVRVPKGYFPQDDTGLIFGITEASTDTSFQAINALQREVMQIVKNDPAVAGVGGAVGSSGYGGGVNRGRLYISLKPLAERGGLSAEAVIARMRRKINTIPGLRTFLTPSQVLRSGARSGKSTYQFTLWDPDINELSAVVPKVVEQLQKLPQLVDVSTDRDPNGLQASVDIDRVKAARLGVSIQAIDDALNNAFSQRQISTIYGPRNQYKVVLEVDPKFQSDPSDLTRIHVAAKDGTQVPLTALARITRTLAPLAINHQGQFPAVTITYDLAQGVSLQAGSDAILQAVAAMHLPDNVHTEFAGNARDFANSAGAEPLLLLGALAAIYIVLGVLYESLAHPLTIISTLPSAGLGALIALLVTRTDLTVIAFIGIILLIGIVKKNGIMLVDFALEAERMEGLPPLEAIREACLERFRPILMTTLAAIFGALPLIIATGPGADLRRPLGITIVGGLIVSQVLTLYTTPVIYLMLDKMHQRLWGARTSMPQSPMLPDKAPQPLGP